MVTKIQKDYGTVPNESDAGKQFAESANELTWFHAMTLGVQKHSELMRPWDSDDFADMEYRYPDVLDNVDDHKPILQQSLELIPGGIPLCSGCYFRAEVLKPAIDDVYCDNGQICFPISSVFCLAPEYLQQYNDGTLTYSEAFAQTWARIRWSWAVVSISAGAGGTPSLYVVPNSNKLNTSAYICLHSAGGWPLGTFGIRVTAQDAYGNFCSDTQELTCEDCCLRAEYVAPKIDRRRSASLISAGYTGYIYVDDDTGCGPYSWTIVDGWGWTLTNATTESRTNSISVADRLYCGYVDADEVSPTCTIQVTDDCANSAQYIIRSNRGTWLGFFSASSAALVQPRQSWFDSPGDCNPLSNCPVDNSDLTWYNSSTGYGRANQWVNLIYDGTKWEAIAVEGLNGSYTSTAWYDDGGGAGPCDWSPEDGFWDWVTYPGGHVGHRDVKDLDGNLLAVDEFGDYMYSDCEFDFDILTASNNVCSGTDAGGHTGGWWINYSAPGCTTPGTSWIGVGLEEWHWKCSTDPYSP